MPDSRVVSATEAVRKFSSIVAEVREKGAVYVVERSGKPVARIGPAGQGDAYRREVRGPRSGRSGR